MASSPPAVMPNVSVVLIIFCLTNGISDGDASHQNKAASWSTSYCHRMAPAFITSVVTPCTYPCLLVSPYKHPHIVVYSEPDGTLCRITSGLNHRMKVGKCKGSVCRATSSHTTLKRKKRFICLYTFVKLIQAKKRLRELKQVISRLEQEAARRSPGDVDSLGDRGVGTGGISGGGRAALGGGLNVGNRENSLGGNVLSGNGPGGGPGIGGSISSSGRNMAIGNVGRIGGPGSRMSGTTSARISGTNSFGFPREDTSGIAPDTSASNILGNSGLTANDRGDGRIRVPADISFPSRGSRDIVNNGRGGRPGLDLGDRFPIPNISVNGGADASGAHHAVPGSAPSSTLLGGSSSGDVGNNGVIIVDAPRFGGRNRGEIRMDLSSTPNVGRPILGEIESGSGGSGISTTGDISGGRATAGFNTGPSGGNINVSDLDATGGGMTDSAIGGNSAAFPSGLRTGDIDIGNAGLGTGSPNFVPPTLGTTSVGNGRAGSTVASSFSGSGDGGISTTGASEVSSSGGAVASVMNVATSTAASGSGGPNLDAITATSTTATSRNVNVAVSRAT